MSQPKSCWLLMGVLLASGACASSNKRGGSEGDATEGVASFYHDSLAGNLTANGERYDPDAATCAHRRLAFGTWLEVTSVSTGASARCRVNDRGPFVAGRILDVSRSVARKLGMLDKGVLRVRIINLGKGKGPPVG